MGIGLDPVHSELPPPIHGESLLTMKMHNSQGCGHKWELRARSLLYISLLSVKDMDTVRNRTSGINENVKILL